MSEELKQAGGNQHLEKPIAFTAELARPAHVYDLRRSVYLGKLREIPVTLDPWQPALFALLPEPAAPETLVESLLNQAAAR